MNKFTAFLKVALLGLASQTSASMIIMDKIIAVVDEDVIMQSELDSRKQAIKSQLTGAGQQPPPEDILNSQIVERLIVESLQLQMAERAGVRISDEELNDAMNRIAARAGPTQGVQPNPNASPIR